MQLRLDLNETLTKKWLEAKHEYEFGLQCGLFGWNPDGNTLAGAPQEMSDIDVLCCLLYDYREDEVAWKQIGYEWVEGSVFPSRYKKRG